MVSDKDHMSIQELQNKIEKAYGAWPKYRT
jgi:hypothetical protein